MNKETKLVSMLFSKELYGKLVRALGLEIARTGENLHLKDLIVRAVEYYLTRQSQDK